VVRPSAFSPSIEEVDCHPSHQVSRPFRLAKENLFTLYPHFLREPESADAFAARRADFGPAAASSARSKSTMRRTGNRLFRPDCRPPSGFAEGTAAQGSDGIILTASRASVLLP
jgi:hypothetical protein